MSKWAYMLSPIFPPFVAKCYSIRILEKCPYLLLDLWLVSLSDGHHWACDYSVRAGHNLSAPLMALMVSWRLTGSHLLQRRVSWPIERPGQLSPEIVLGRGT
jgi:hypothetical protein